ncbi:MAG: AAA family ATPase [Christensenellaceae bacterium]
MLTDNIKSEIKKVIVGKDEIIEKVLTAILAQGHILLEDVPGVGKTSLALAFSKALGLDCKRIQFTPDTMPSDVTGFSVFEKSNSDFVYKPGAVMTNLLVADEINRTSSKTQSALLEAMEEGKVTVDGINHKLRPVHRSCNRKSDRVGRNAAAARSQLDRFMFKLSMGYPDIKSQVEILRDRHRSDPLDDVKAVCSANELVQTIDVVRQTFICDEVYEYIAELAEQTRHHESVQFGISPRGALAVSRAAKAYAYLSRRDYVTADDVAAVFRDVCAHRLVLNTKARMRGYTETDVADEIVSEHKKPGVKDFKRR